MQLLTQIPTNPQRTRRHGESSGSYKDRSAWYKCLDAMECRQDNATLVREYKTLWNVVKDSQANSY